MVFRAVTVLLKPFHMKKYSVRRLLCFECLSSTDAAPPDAGSAFLPNVFSDITPHIDRKIEILNAYGTEAQPEPLPRTPSAVRALARYRGATIGVEYAEAFMLIREIA
jgi:LmbE family N-acetylglucosaminyl deacetylase